MFQESSYSLFSMAHYHKMLYFQMTFSSLGISAKPRLFCSFFFLISDKMVHRFLRTKLAKNVQESSAAPCYEARNLDQNSLGDNDVAVALSNPFESVIKCC